MHTRTHQKKTPVLWKTGGKEWVPLKRVSLERQPKSDFSAARGGGSGHVQQASHWHLRNKLSS